MSEQLRNVNTFAASAVSSFAASGTSNLGAVHQVAAGTFMGGYTSVMTGGRFLDGAAQGAIITTTNHLMHEGANRIKQKRVTKELQALAHLLHYTPSTALFTNPFHGAAAAFFDGGVNWLGTEYDKGLFFVLAGDDAGEFVPYSERAGGAAIAAGVGLEIGRIDYTGPIGEFKKDMLFGLRDKGWASFIAGGSYATSTVGQYKIRGSAVNIGIGISPWGLFDFGGNAGEIY